jgi:lambda family phage portal protein
MNAIDKAIDFVAPVWGRKRLHARTVMAIAGGFSGARTDRRATQTWATSFNSPDADNNPDLQKLRDRSRDLVRNTPIATGAVLTVVQNAIGSGLTLMARPDSVALKMSDDQAQKWKDTVESEFRLWAESKSCDITEQTNFYGLQSLAFRSCLESGDTIALLPMITDNKNPYTLKVQLVEADRLANPRDIPDIEGETYAGIKTNENTGAPQTYWIRKFHPGSFKGMSDWTATGIAARGPLTGRKNVIHVFDRTRPGQSRGVPYLAPVIESLKQLDRYTEAEIMAAVVNAMLTVFIETANATGLENSPELISQTGINPNNEIMLGSGTIVDLAPGEKQSAVTPSRPNAQFDPFVIAILRQIGVALGLPFEILVKHFTASYSAARAALLEAWRFFRLKREFMAQQFCDPIYEAWMEEAISLGRINAPGFFADPAIRLAYLQCDWVGDAQGAIDPLKEAQAAQARVEGHFSTRAEETLSMSGGVWENKVKQMGKEQELLKKYGLAQPEPLPPGEAAGATATDTGSDLETESAPPKNKNGGK